MAGYLFFCPIFREVRVLTKILSCPSVFNIRDLGETPTTSGEKIKTQRLIRSSALDRLTTVDLDYLRKLNVKTIIDLRSPQECQAFPDQISSDMYYYQLPVFPTDQAQIDSRIIELREKYDQNPLAGFYNMVNTYRSLVQQPFSKKAFHDFLTLVVTRLPAGGVLYHCTSGKDRTGMATVYLLKLLGVDFTAIRQDYLISNQQTATERKRIVNVLKQQNANWILQATTRSLRSVKEEYLNAAIFEIFQESGNLHDYLQQELQITPQLVQQLRSLVLTDETMPKEEH